MKYFRQTFLWVFQEKMNKLASLESFQRQQQPARRVSTGYEKEKRRQKGANCCSEANKTNLAIFEAAYRDIFIRQKSKRLIIIIYSPSIQPVSALVLRQKNCI